MVWIDGEDFRLHNFVSDEVGDLVQQGQHGTHIHTSRVEKPAYFSRTMLRPIVWLIVTASRGHKPTKPGPRYTCLATGARGCQIFLRASESVARGFESRGPVYNSLSIHSTCYKYQRLYTRDLAQMRPYFSLNKCRYTARKRWTHYVTFQSGTRAPRRMSNDSKNVNQHFGWSPGDRRHGFLYTKNSPVRPRKLYFFFFFGLLRFIPICTRKDFALGILAKNLKPRYKKKSSLALFSGKSMPFSYIGTVLLTK